MLTCCGCVANAEQTQILQPCPWHTVIRGRTLEQRFWTKVNKAPGLGPRGDCWEWIANRLKGYGIFSGSGRRGGTHRAHRLAYQLCTGPIPDGHGVLHACDHPPCVNPAHLYTGTQGQNNADCLQRGRFRPVRGERSCTAKLAAAQVREIRALWVAGLTSRALEQRFGVTDSQILNIVHRRAWAHVA